MTPSPRKRGTHWALRTLDEVPAPSFPAQAGDLAGDRLRGDREREIAGYPCAISGCTFDFDSSGVRLHNHPAKVEAQSIPAGEALPGRICAVEGLG